jgi:hypothetical protein
VAADVGRVGRHNWIPMNLLLAAVILFFLTRLKEVLLEGLLPSKPPTLAIPA